MRGNLNEIILATDPDRQVSMALYCNLGAREKTTSHFGRVQNLLVLEGESSEQPCPSTAPSREFAPNVALFLDVDGTLLEFADRPEAVFPNDGLTDILLGLEVTLGGAIALISGRTIEDDRIFDPIRLPAGGQHGLERRDAKAGCTRPARACAGRYRSSQGIRRSKSRFLARRQRCGLSIALSHGAIVASCRRGTNRPIDCQPKRFALPRREYGV